MLVRPSSRGSSAVRRYYGRVGGPEQLARASGASLEAASKALEILRDRGVVDAAGVVALDADRKAVAGYIDDPSADAIAGAVLESRYSALSSLLGDVFDEKQYLAIVDNRVLVDVQGGDVLLQLFTKPVLQGAPSHEAPFLEFIQRVCSTKRAPRAGCGGFGVRNFLVLFLSIELNAAMAERRAASDDASKKTADAKIDCLGRQLAASSPVLSDVSDAAADEAAALDASDDAALANARAKKAAANDALKAISAAHADEMRRIRCTAE